MPSVGECYDSRKEGPCLRYGGGIECIPVYARSGSVDASDLPNNDYVIDQIVRARFRVSQQTRCEGFDHLNQCIELVLSMWYRVLCTVNQNAKIFLFRQMTMMKISVFLIGFIHLLPQCQGGNWVSRNAGETKDDVHEQVPPRVQQTRHRVLPHSTTRDEISSKYRNPGEVHAERSAFTNSKPDDSRIRHQGPHSVPLINHSIRTNHRRIEDTIREKAKAIVSPLHDKRYAVNSLKDVTSTSYFISPKGKVSLHVRLGEGSYGKVYSGTLCGDNGSCRSVAVKFQKPLKRVFNFPFGLPDHYGEIEHEYAMMKRMRDVDGFPKPRTANFAGAWKYYLTDLLGKDVYEISTSYDFRVPLQTAIFLTRQMLLRIQGLHVEGYVAQDIHSGNFVMDHKGTVYMIDLAFAFPWRMENGDHIPDQPSHFPQRKLRRPPMATRREEKGLETSRADDLERLLYILLEMLGGPLPWEEVKDPVKAMEMKRYLTDDPQRLCKHLNVPWLGSLFATVFRLKFSEEPPYSDMDRELRRLSRRSDLASFRR